MCILPLQGLQANLSEWSRWKVDLRNHTLRISCTFSKSEKRSSSTLALNKSGEGYKKSMFRTSSDGLLETPLQHHYRSLLLQSKNHSCIRYLVRTLPQCSRSVIGLGASTNSYFRHLLSYLADFFDLSTDTSRMISRFLHPWFAKNHLDIEPLQERLNILEPRVGDDPTTWSLQNYCSTNMSYRGLTNKRYYFKNIN